MGMQSNHDCGSKGESMGCRGARIGGTQGRNDKVENMTVGYESHSIF